MALEFQTVAIPVVKGINVTTSARLLPPTMLLEALNSRFPTGSGATKRRGHISRVARNADPIPVGVSPPSFDAPSAVDTYYTGDRGFPSGWLFGWGALTEEYSHGEEPCETSRHPDPGLLFGAASRDQEAIVWSGHQLLSRVPSQVNGGPLPSVDAVMPVLKAEPIGKANVAQNHPECADNGRIRVVAWESEGDLGYAVYDSTTGAALVAPTILTASLAVADVAQLKIIPVGGWIHILAIGSLELLQRRSIHSERPRDVVAASLGTCVDYFDYWKVSETEWVVLRNGGEEDLFLTWHAPDGTSAFNRTNSEPEFTAAGDDPITALGPVAVAVHPVTERICIVARTEINDGGVIPGVWAEVFNADGTPYSEATAILDAGGDPPGGAIETDDGARALTVAPKYLYHEDDGTEVFDVYYDSYSGPNIDLWIWRIDAEAATLYTQRRFHLGLASKAFRVGNRTYCWAFHRSTLQSTWFLVDEKLLPVGHCNYITAATLDTVVSGEGDTAEFHSLFSVNWSGEAPAKDIVVHHHALGYRVRVPSEVGTVGTNPPAIYTEPSIQLVTLDFLPPLRSAQAGRSTYFAGAQVWAYDGTELTEAGFHLAPEGVTASLGGSGGGLTTDGVYQWRVDLCYRNAQNEEIRSHSFFTDQETAASGQVATITIPTVLTRRSGSYFLVFRNAASGTEWYLVSSRDPSSSLFVANDPSLASVTFTDNGTDTPTDSELQALEPHPSNGSGYLQPIAAPACEVIAAGHDRLWVSGGEIPPGQIHPSRLYIPGEAPSFNPLLLVQVDRSIEPITAIGFVGETRAFFRSTQTYVHEGSGPDNSSNGFWETPRLAYSDVGAVGPEGLALIAPGLLFQSPAGIRLIAPGGGLQAIGFPTDAVAKDLDIVGTLVSGADQEVRFYARSGNTLVYNYQYDIWTAWDVTAVGVTRNPATGLAILARPDGYLWDETDGEWLDNGSPYNHRIRFSWLRAGDVMDFQRVRRIGGLGTWEEPHSVHVDVYYDEREFAEEWFDWDVPDSSQNTDTFGSLNFGDGAFGDTDSDT